MYYYRLLLPPELQEPLLKPIQIGVVEMKNILARNGIDFSKLQPSYKVAIFFPWYGRFLAVVADELTRKYGLEKLRLFTKGMLSPVEAKQIEDDVKRIARQTVQELLPDIKNRLGLATLSA